MALSTPFTAKTGTKKTSKKQPLKYFWGGRGVFFSSVGLAAARPRRMMSFRLAHPARSDELKARAPVGRSRGWR